MTTTAVFAEILTVGVQALVWMVMAVWVIIRWNDTSNLSLDQIKGWLGSVKEWTPLVSLAILTVAYSAGVVVDRVADSILGWVWPKPGAGATRSRRLYVRYKGGQLIVFFDYVRSRIRVARSTVLNILLVTIVGCLALRDSAWLITFGLAAVFVLSVTAFAWRRIERTYWLNLNDAVAMIKKDGKKRSE